MVKETEAERRYKVDQVIASARLEGLSLSSEALVLLTKYIDGSNTLEETVRLGLENAHHEAALARQKAGDSLDSPPLANLDDPYTYRGTQVLINKMNLRDPAALQRFETDCVGFRTLALM